MKLRTDFVTNSSSSSFISMRIKSSKFEEILNDYESQLERLAEYGCFVTLGSDGTFDFNADEWGMSVPCGLDEVPEVLADFFDEIFCCIEENEDVEYDGENIDIAEDIRNNAKEIISTMESAEISSGDIGWGGDSDSRYYMDNYDEDTLQVILESIAEEKGYESVDDVEEDDFCDYVSDQTSSETDTFTYDKSDREHPNGVCSHSFSLEF